MEGLANFISFFNLPASYIVEHFIDRCFVEYRTSYNILRDRLDCIEALRLDEQVLDKLIDGSINENFDKHDVELIEAYNNIEEFRGDKYWGRSYTEVRSLISRAKNIEPTSKFELSLRPGMSDISAVETKLGLNNHKDLEVMNVSGCDLILVVNCIDLYDMFCQYRESIDVDKERFNILLRECFEFGFITEKAPFWKILYEHRLVIAYFNKDMNSTSEQNHIRTQSLNYWNPNHELSCFIVRLRYDESSCMWAYN